MSSVEEQLRRDIAAVTKGVVVSDSDLRDARASLEERIEINEQRGRNRTFLAAAAAAVVVAAVGFTAFQALSEDDSVVTPAGEGESTDLFADFLEGAAPTPENLNGFWRVDNNGIMVRFNMDGTVQFSDQGAVISDPDTVGTYTVDGDRITVKASKAPRCVSPVFTMRAGVPDPGHVNIVLSEPNFGTCASVATTIALEHVVPTDSGLEDFDNNDARGWKPVTDDTSLFGDWMAEGGGYLLELAQGAETDDYYVVDESAQVVDNGYWRLRDGVLELFSRTESPQCKEGDWLRLGNLEGVDGTSVIRGNVEQNDCGGGWTPIRWIRIPDNSPSDTSGS